MATDTASLLGKFRSNDKDHRYMATSDLLKQMERPNWMPPPHMNDCSNLCDALLKQLDDTSGDVVALAVKCLVEFVKSERLHASFIKRIVETCCTKLAADRGKRSNPSTDSAGIAIKAIVLELPQSAAGAAAEASIPSLREGIASKDQAVARDCLDALLPIISHCGVSAQQAEELGNQLLNLLATPVGRKAVPCIPALAAQMHDASPLVAALLARLEAASAGAAPSHAMALGGLARSLGFRFAPFADDLVPLLARKCGAAGALEEEEAELREAALHALASVVQFCPAAARPHTVAIADLALVQLSYDPNLIETSDNEEMAEADASGAICDDEYEIADDDDDYEGEGDFDADEDDDSWKVRRAAAALLVAMFRALPDQIELLHSVCRARLVARFKEREQSARLDILSAYSELVRQVCAGGSEASAASLASGNDVLALVRQLRGGTDKLRAGAFGALCALVRAADGRAAFACDGVQPACEVLQEPGAGNVLKMEALLFLRLVCVAEAAHTLTAYLPSLCSALKSALSEKYYKLVAEALRNVEGASAMLATGIAAGGTDASAACAASQELFDAVAERLAATDQDTEVKVVAIRAMGALVASASNTLAPSVRHVLPILQDRLNAEGTRAEAVACFGTIAAAPTRVSLAPVLTYLLDSMGTFLRKVQRDLRHATLDAAVAVLRSEAGTLAESGPESVVALIKEAAPLVSETDLPLAAAVLRMASAAVTAVPSLPTSKECAPLIDAAVKLSRSPLLSTATRDALSAFFCALRDTGAAQLSSADLRYRLLGSCPDDAARGSQRSVAACVAALCAGHEAAAAETLGLCCNVIASSKTSAGKRSLMLLLVGEIGRVVDLSAHPAARDAVIGALSTGISDTQATAALALGGVAVGSLAGTLPLLLSTAAQAASDGESKRLYLLLRSLNEVLRSLLAKREAMPSEQQARTLALLEASASVVEEVAAVVADCVAQLAFAEPAKLLPWMRDRLQSATPEVRSCVTAAARHMVHEGVRYPSIDIVGHMRAFLAALRDAHHSVRHEAVLLLSTVIASRPDLARRNLGDAFPALLALTISDNSLIKTVDLGPFKQTVDDGLAMRKHAYECLESLLSRPAFRDQIDYHGIAGTLPRGLADDVDIKRTCYSIMCHLSNVAPSALLAYLADMLQPLGRTLGMPIKDDAIPQERERYEDVLRGALMAVAAAARTPQAMTAVPKLKEFMQQRVNAKEDMLARYIRAKAELEKTAC